MTEEKKELEWPMDKVRQTFIDFFVKKHQHVFWPSSPCVPVDDPTLLFTNAGMNQYKPLFLGTCDPTLKMASLKRAVNSQKCIRAGGKHNDLDDVGKDVYHHTFFEMLGNWSFGDYFKKEAIEMAWKCLTEEFKLDKERLYATYFGGDESSPCDDEARELWLQFLPPERVLPFDAKDNFWEMGATGPCGPCTEIHYDRIGGRDASKLVNADLPDVIEIWNNVFIQYNREADGSLRNLPAQHIDTGMGFERLTSILQGVDSNYDTDIFMPLFAAIQKETGARPYAGKVGAEDEGYVDMAYRVVADHVRTLCFAIADGATPSNADRGYVLRRVLRRAVRYGRQNLGAELGFFSKLVPTLVVLMGNTFPELKTKQEHVTAVIRDEEESFNRTLDKGLQKFNELVEKMGDSKVFSGEDAHFLYTSMGFPVDLTELMAEEKGLTIDKDGFEKKMQEEIKLSREARDAKMSGGSGKDMRMVAEQTSHLVSKAVPATDDSAKYVWDQKLEGCNVAALFLGRNETEDKIGFVESATKESSTIGVVLDKTSYYAESGGQIYDTGSITTGGATVRVDSVQIYGQFVVHVGEVTDGTITVGETAACSVDYKRRSPIAANHTMTHVLNYALRKVLIEDGDGKATTTVDQKGSLVDESKLRFDFSWNGQLSPEQLAKVEALCVDRIEKEVPVDAYVAPLDDAQKISSLRAVFGEKYPDPVRVVAVSNSPVPEMLANPQDSQWKEYSVEFCGGTHLKNTKEAEAFVLLSEEGIAKGVRRIVAVTQKDAKEAIKLAEEFEGKLKEADKIDGEAALEAELKVLKARLNELSISSVKKHAFREKITELTKKVLALKKKKASGMTGEIVAKAAEAAAATEGNKVVVRFDFGCDGKVWKAVSTAYGKKVKDKALLLVTADTDADRFMVGAVAPKGVDVDCKAWVTAATEGTGGKGGGKKDSAQMNVPGLSHIDAVLEKAKGFA
ncbi:Alanine--tRNA ligase [Seminavis robusta]|uniref:Alanine--tRNA ligase n=1 Tax=Seminavis robusta TaxID=568900 RepID=A0A9N8DUQ9_9STRA|nr:Alanine--tRNA ligase [Seminavis robusta]|eukprot:Sro372_g128770.1 Alanine--tRNA ligase (964) ;mRNA; f:24777-27788